MTRLTYKLQASGWYESEPILCGYSAIIARFRGLSWQLVSFETGKLVKEGISKNTHGLKKTLKKELISLGAIFGDEIRNKNNLS